MIVEIVGNNFYDTWRLQIYTEMFFPCTQHSLLKLLKCIRGLERSYGRRAVCGLLGAISGQITYLEELKRSREPFFLFENDLKKLYKNKALLEKELAEYDED